jgi:hypothetical protein
MQDWHATFLGRRRLPRGSEVPEPVRAIVHCGICGGAAGVQLQGRAGIVGGGGGGRSAAEKWRNASISIALSARGRRLSPRQVVCQSFMSLYPPSGAQ